MSLIEQVDFQKQEEDSFEFEIIDLNEFLTTRPSRHLSKVHRLNFYILIYVTKGRGRHEIDFKEFDFEAGNVILISKNQTHRFVVEPDQYGYVVMFTDRFLYRNRDLNILDFLKYFNNPMYKSVVEIDMSENETNRILMDTMYREYLNKNEGLKTKILESLFKSFMLTLRRDSNISDREEYSASEVIFIEFKDLVETYYKEKKSVKEYANMMLVTQKTINQATRKVVGMSAKEFIVDRILLEIKRYLAQGKLSINEISDLMGFDEPSNFTKFFKRYEKISPKEFKTMYMEEVK